MVGSHRHGMAWLCRVRGIFWVKTNMPTIFFVPILSVPYPRLSSVDDNV